MALFDVNEWKQKRPSELKASGIAAALEKWGKACPDDPAEVKSDSAYADAYSAVEDAIKTAKETSSAEQKKIEISYETKKKKIKDQKQIKALDEECKDKCLEKFLKVNNLLSKWSNDLLKYKRGYLAGKAKKDGVYDKHLNEIAQGYKSCVEAMRMTEHEVSEINKMLTKMKSNVEEAVKNAGGGDDKLVEELQRVKLQYRRFMPKMQSKIETVDENLRTINARNKESKGDLRMKIVEYHISEDDVQRGVLSKLYDMQAKSSNLVLAGYRQAKLAFKEVEVLLA